MAQSRMAIGSGLRWKFTAARTVSVGHVRARSKCATCPSACTPASVRPAPRSETVSPQNLAMASVSRPCTDMPAACTCQPTNGVPSYSSVTR